MGKRNNNNGKSAKRTQSTSVGASSSPSWLLVVGGAVAAAVASAVLLLAPVSLDEEGSSQVASYDELYRSGPERFPESVKQVEVVDWAKVRPTLPEGTTLSSYLKERGVALKLINSGPEEWPAAQLTPTSMFDKFRQAGNDTLWLMQQDVRENMYHEEYLAKILETEGLEVKSNSKTVAVRMDRLYKLFRQANDRTLDPPRYWYLNGQLGPPPLAEQVTLPADPEEYSVFDGGERFKHNEAAACKTRGFKKRLCPSEAPNLRIWLGSADMVACMHYDTSYNTHTVLYGENHDVSITTRVSQFQTSD